MSDTDTPRVDAAEISMDRRDLLPIAKLPEYANLARALERENRRLRSVLEECIRFIDPMDDPFGSLDKARAALAGEND